MDYFNFSDFEDAIKKIVEDKFKNNTSVTENGRTYLKDEYYNDILRKMLEKGSETELKSILEDASEYAKSFDFVESKRRVNYQESLNDTIVLLKTLMMNSFKLGEYLVSKITITNKKASGKDFIKSALIKLHQRCMEVFGEIITLIESGYPNGVYARWRSLYEYSVVITILTEKDSEELTARYLSHDIVMIYKSLSRTMKLENYYGTDDFPEIEKEYKYCIRKYGKEYKNAYGWFSENPKINLFELSKLANLENLYGYVNVSHAFNHGTSFNLLHDNNRNFAEKINELEIPLQNTVNSIALVNQLTIQYFLKYEKKQTLVSSIIHNLFLDLANKTIESYFKERNKVDPSRHVLSKFENNNVTNKE